MGLSEAPLPPSFYQGSNVVALAEALIGCNIHTILNGKLCSARITETEAYSGKNDKACHAYGNRRTKRTEIMYAPGGVAYMYLCYGIHHLFNIITNVENKADAVLVRAAEPLEGIEHMLSRRNMRKSNPKLSSGPGNFSKALGLNSSFYGSSLQGPEVWLTARKTPIHSTDIVRTTRIGIDYAKEDAALPWRFYLKDSAFVSKK